MNKVIWVLTKIVIAVILLLVVWFGLSPWLMNQASDLLYSLGVATNLLILIVDAYIIKSIFKEGK